MRTIIVLVILALKYYQLIINYKSITENKNMRLSKKGTDRCDLKKTMAAEREVGVMDWKGIKIITKTTVTEDVINY